MSGSSSPQENDLAVLREMVRLAENRRSEEIENLERVNRYNLALIAFSGSFLSLLVSTGFSIVIVRSAGLSLLTSISFSLLALLPRRIKGALVIDDDVKELQQGKHLPLPSYLLTIADLTDQAASTANQLSRVKKRLTLIAAIFLALSLAVTYILYAYAQTW